LYDRVEDAQKKIAEVVFHRENPTVEEYCEKWLLMRSGTVRTNTLEGYARMVNRYIVGPIGQMYMDEVTTDDLRLLMVPLSKGSSGMYGQLNMLIKNIFNSAEESKVIKENPSKTICARGGKPAKRREALTDEQTAILLDSIRELPPYVFLPAHRLPHAMHALRKCTAFFHSGIHSPISIRESLLYAVPRTSRSSRKHTVEAHECYPAKWQSVHPSKLRAVGLEVHNSPFYRRTLLLHLCKWTVHQA